MKSLIVIQSYTGTYLLVGVRAFWIHSVGTLKLPRIKSSHVDQGLLQLSNSKIMFKNQFRSSRCS